MPRWDWALRSRAGRPFGSCVVRAVRALFCVLIALSTISAQTADTTIASRNAKVGGLD